MILRSSHVIRQRETIRCVRAFVVLSARSQSTGPPPWRQATTLDEWVGREVRPISLRQLTFFGRTLTERRLLESANYVRTELPTRIAHRLRNMQKLPYAVITNANMKHVYDLYYKAFDAFRRVPVVQTIEDNDQYCKVLQRTLREHLSVIPRLVIGVLECQGLVPPDETDRFINSLLRSRISRRVIAEQHLALTETFHSPRHFPDDKLNAENHSEFIGEVFLRCNAKEVVERCASTVKALSQLAYGPHVQLPDVIVNGHLDATLTYIPSHLEYIIGELLRNSFQAVVEQHPHTVDKPPPIEVLVCESPQHVIFRVSDRGGGVPHSILPHLWSFVKGPRRLKKLENLNKVPQLSATLQELKVASEAEEYSDSATKTGRISDTSLRTLSGRPPNLRLGIGLPMSRVYAEYWAGSLELHSLEGYGVDAFLHVPKLGNRNEQLHTRTEMDAL